MLQIKAATQKKNLSAGCHMGIVRVAHRDRISGSDTRKKFNIQAGLFKETREHLNPSFFAPTGNSQLNI